MLLTIGEAAAKARVSKSLLYDLCARGLIPHIRLGRPGRRGTLRIDSNDLDGFLAGCRIEGGKLDDGELTFFK